LLANLEKRSTHGELDCYLEVGNNVLERDNLVDEATGDVFALPSVKAFSRIRLKGLLFYLLYMMVFVVIFLVVVINSYH